MARTLYFVVAGVAYCIFFAVFLYLVGFVANLPMLPRTVDIGPLGWGWQSLAVDVGLIALFGLQHSVMARQGFKAAWTKIVPPPIERSVYVLITSLILILLFVAWHPIPVKIWRVDNEIGQYVLWALFALGWAIVLLSTFLINHFELFGLAQVWRHARSKAVAAPTFYQPLFYRLVRHPLYSGFIIAFWATPWMTVGHLVLALGMTIYIVIAIQYEERDLIAAFGDEYVAYKGKVGMLTPRFRRAR